MSGQSKHLRSAIVQKRKHPLLVKHQIIYVVTAAPRGSRPMRYNTLVLLEKDYDANNDIYCPHQSEGRTKKTFVVLLAAY